MLIDLATAWVEAAYYNRANAHARTSANDDARVDYDRALELAAEDPDILVNRGLLSLYERDFAAAEGDFREALRLRPRDSAAQTNLGLALLYEDQADDALSAFSEAVEIEPDQPGAHYGAASAAASLGRADEAMTSLETAISLNDRYADAARSDDRFADLHEDPRFQALTANASAD